MKSTFTALLFLCASSLTIALPEGWEIRRADDLPDNVQIVDLQVFDEDRFPGINFTGTAKSIFDEMHNLNPDLVPEVPASTAPEVQSKRSVEKRATFNCGYGSWIRTWGDCVEGYDYLKALGTSACGTNGNTCARVSCSRGCGVFLCNKQSSHYWAHCQSIADDIFRIAERCGESYLNGAFYRVKGAFDFDRHYVGLTDQRC